MSEKTILAIDNGTQSVRAILFDLRRQHRRQIAGPSRRLFFASIPAGPSTIRKATGRPCARHARACGRSRAWTRPASQGVAVTTQRGTVINLDAQGKPLRPAITWLDQRAHLTSCRRSAPGGARRSGWRGVSGTIDYFRGQAEINWIKARAARYLGPDRQVPAAVRLPELPPVRALRRLHRLAGGLRALRLQGAPLGRQARLEMAGAGDQAVDAARTGARRAP